MDKLTGELINKISDTAQHYVSSYYFSIVVVDMNSHESSGVRLHGIEAYEQDLIFLALAIQFFSNDCIDNNV